MDRGAWWAIAHGIVRVGHDLATKPIYLFNTVMGATDAVENQ